MTVASNPASATLDTTKPWTNAPSVTNPASVDTILMETSPSTTVSLHTTHPTIGCLLSEHSHGQVDAIPEHTYPHPWCFQ